MLKSPREVVEAWVEAFKPSGRRRRGSAVPRGRGQPASGCGRTDGRRQAMRDGFAYFFRAFPDNYTTPVNLFVDGSGPSWL